MTDSEITLSVLREIRDSIRTMDTRLSGRIDSTNSRADTTNSKLDALTEKVDKGFERMDLTFAHFVVELKDLAVQIMLLGRYARLDVSISRVEATNTRLDMAVSQLDVANSRFDMSLDDPFGIRATSDETWAILRELGIQEARRRAPPTTR